jgi:hypothetical protein
MKLFAGLSAALLSGAVYAQVVDTTVPGAFSFSPVTAPGSYDVTVTISVTDQPGTTGTKATFVNVGGGVLTSNSSGRGGGAFWEDRILNTTSVTLRAADGSQPVTFAPAVNTQGTGRHRSWTTWSASGSVPVGTYTMEIAGTLTCISARFGVESGCVNPPPKELIVSTATSTPLPATYWWSDVSSPSGSYLDLINVRTNEQVQVPHLYGVFKTFPGDNSGPQQVCDQYDGVLASALQNFFNINGTALQVDGVTSTVANNVCDYKLAYEDPTNPGVVLSYDFGSTIVVVVDSGSDLRQAPQPPADEKD